MNPTMRDNHENRVAGLVAIGFIVAAFGSIDLP
jgi:hypothetical protein